MDVRDRDEIVTARSARRARARFAVALAVATVLAGCGGGSPAGGPQLVMGRVGDAVGLDPANQDDGLSLTVTQEIYQNLVAFKPGSFDVVPQIASSWTTSADGKSWTFDLRPGLKFSDGTPLDAGAVKFNFDRWRLSSDPYHGTQPYPYWAAEFGGFPGIVRDVRVDAPTRVTFVLAAPMGPFLRDLAMPSFAIASPAAVKAHPSDFNLNPVGSGPYALGEWVKDDHLTLIANPLYDGPPPAYKRVIIRDIPDQATSVLSMQKGDIDGLIDPRPDDVKDLQAQKNLVVYRQPSNNLMYLAMNVEKKPFGNVLVRRAIGYAIDKAAIATNFYATGATVADNWTPPGMLGENPSVKAYPFDPSRAKQLLAQAGFPSGFATELFYPTAPRPYMPEPQRIAEAIQANLRAIGVNVTLEPFEFGVFLQKVRNGEHPMCLIGWTGDNGDPDNFMYTLLDKDSAVKGQAQNYTFWKDEAFHELMMAGQHSVDESKRAAIYAQANAMIAGQAPAIALTHSTVTFVMKDTVDGVVPSPDSKMIYELMKPKAGS